MRLELFKNNNKREMPDDELVDVGMGPVEEEPEESMVAALGDDAIVVDDEEEEDEVDEFGADTL